MSKFNVPTVGSTITVSTYYKSHVIGRTKADDTTTYENVPVLPPQSWTPSGSFCIPAENEPFIKFRTIAIDKVVDLVIHDGDTVDSEHGTKVVAVAGSNDKIYSVVVTDGVAQSCDCMGFQYRRNCRHLRIAVDEKPVNPRRKTAKKKSKKKVAKRKTAAKRTGKGTKAEQVRDIIRKRKSAMKNQKRETVALVQEWCITDTVDKIGFDRGLAKRYVMNNWEKAQ
jgi:hypothetical protein